jgi:hypothetical protein
MLFVNLESTSPSFYDATYVLRPVLGSRLVTEPSAATMEDAKEEGDKTCGPGPDLVTYMYCTLPDGTGVFSYDSGMALTQMFQDICIQNGRSSFRWNNTPHVSKFVVTSPRLGEEMRHELHQFRQVGFRRVQYGIRTGIKGNTPHATCHCHDIRCMP